MCRSPRHLSAFITAAGSHDRQSSMKQIFVTDKSADNQQQKVIHGILEALDVHEYPN